MIKRTLKPLYLLGALIVLISLACSAGGGSPTEAPQSPASNTAAPVLPTETPVEVKASATEAPVAT